jgi:hypothetical protein
MRTRTAPVTRLLARGEVLPLACATALSLSCGSGSSSASSTADAGQTDGSSGGSSGSSGGISGSSSGSSSSSSGGGDSGSPKDAGPGKDAGVPINPNAFYVATNGNDGNPGTLSKPFATLAQAQKAMQASSTIKTTYVRAGTYKPPSTGGNCVWGNPAGSSIGLSSADQGETWSFYPPDGYGSAILDGQSTMGNSGGTGGDGTGCAFGASQVSDVTIVGLQFQHYLYAAFWGYAASNAHLTDNVIHDTTAAVFSSGGILLVASPGATITNNYLHDLAYMGIVVSDNSAGGDGMGNTTVSGNAVTNACTWPAVSGGGNDENGGDCGGIYFWSQHPSISTNMRIENNLVRDVNVSSKGAGDFGSCCAQGIYLDDGTNNVTATGNVVTGITSACFQIHGGQDNVIRGNLCDLGASGTGAIVEYQNDMLTQMTGNVFEDNVVVAGSSGPGMGFVGVSSPPNPMTIKDNAYFNYVGSTTASAGTGGTGSDSNPTYVNPEVSCWAPTLGTGSPVTNAPVSFPGIAGGWGPPGFVLPQTGTAPSWPHGC